MKLLSFCKTNWVRYSLITGLVSLILSSCSKEFINPYDPATPADVWMPSNLKLDTLGPNKVQLFWEQDNRHIDGYAVQKFTNGQSKEYLVFRDTIDFIDSNVVESNVEATCPEIRYEVLARAGRNRSLAAGMQTPIYMPLSTPAYAGEDIMVTDTSTSVQLYAQPTLPGESGLWTILSGTGGAFENDHQHNSRFIGTPCNAYILRWTKQGCTETYDELNVSFYPATTTANAGSDQSFNDATTQTTLNANQPATGQAGIWTVVSGEGGVFADASSPTTQFTGQSCTAYVLKWSLSGNCFSSDDIVNISFIKATTAANAGSNQTITTDVTTVTLTANTPASGETGTWSIISGAGGSFSNSNAPNTTFTGNACTAYTLRWTIQGQCSNSSDDLTIGFAQSTTTANAGANQTITNSATTVILTANTPASGETGTWSIISGTGGSFSNTNAPNATFTGNECTNYILQWSIQGPCSTSTDQVSINFQQTPNTANAGSDQTITTSATSVTLSANTPASGETGTWSILSGSGGSFINPNEANATFTGNACTNYILQWSIGTCLTSTDQISINFQQSPNTANAGSDQTASNLTVNLAANAPANGVTGTWSIVSGTGGSFSNVTSPNSTFTGALGQSYVLNWTLIACASTSFDAVVINFPFSGNAICGASDVHNSSLSYSSLIDQQGNIYRTIVIGSQEWMAENLKTTIYRNGDAIANVIDNNQWTNLTSGAWCYYNNDNQYDCPYGKLYNSFAVADLRNLCPAGWHVPTDAEWTILTDYLAGLNNAGGKMKSTGTEYWLNPNIGANNESGFSGLPGGSRSTDGLFSSTGISGLWWTNTAASTTSKWCRNLAYNFNGATRLTFISNGGMSVRCLKN